MSEQKAIKVRIKGRVQGVFFRDWTKRQADELGVMGWIRNRLDGDVEGLFVGPDEAVEKLISKCKEGPPNADVDEVVTEDAQGITTAGFEIKPTV